MSDRGDMKRNVILTFKIGEDKFHAFHLVNWKSRTDHQIKKKDGLYECTCAMARFEKKCPHTNMITVSDEADYKPHTVKRAEKWEEVPSVPFPEHDSFIAIYDEKTKKQGVIHHEVGDLNLCNLLELLTDEDVDSSSLPLISDSKLNRERIYEQCKMSVAKGVDVFEDVVKKAGKDLEPSKYKVPLDVKEEEEEEIVTDPSKLPLWRKIPRPDPKQFYVKKDVWELLMWALSGGKNILLTGPSGSGKSEVNYLAAKALDVSIEPFNMGAMSEPRLSLIGATHFDKDKGTFFNESRFVKSTKGRKEEKDGQEQAVKSIVLLDEITRATQSAFNILLPLMDDQGYLALDESEEASIIHRGEGVAFASTANIGMEYTGTSAMDKALKERFHVIIDMGFPPNDNEVALLINRKKIRSKNAERLVKIATKQREMTLNDTEFGEMISTRLLLNAAEMIHDGMPFEMACAYAFLSSFSSDGGDASARSKVQQIIQKDKTPY